MVECFLLDLFVIDVGVVMYCIGDLVCCVEGGVLEFIGCVD